MLVEAIVAQETSMTSLRDWVGPLRLAEWVTDARQRVFELVGDLDDEQLRVPLLSTVNPLLWEIGHLAWFQEKFVVRDAAGRPAAIDHADALYDSGAVPHDTRWLLDLPDRAATLAYLTAVRDTVLEIPVSYTHLRAHETDSYLVCR